MHIVFPSIPGLPASPLPLLDGTCDRVTRSPAPQTPIPARDPKHLEGAVTARRLHSQLDAACGIAYLTRGPQGVAAGLGRTPLESTGLEGHAPVGDGFPVEALGAFQAIHCVGGVIETGSAIKSLSNTCQALSRRTAIRATFVQSQLELEAAHRSWTATEPSPATEQRLCDAARQAWQARTSKTRLEAAVQQAPEHVVDVVRYAIVSWTSRVFSILKLAFKASTWISLAASIMGVLGSAFQVLAGIVKWHASNRLVQRAKSALRQMEGGTSVAIRAPLHTHLLQHIQRKRSDELHKARDKRTKARVETITGVLAFIFSALAFVFPPLGFVAIATGLAYAGYRVYRGIRTFFSTRELNRREATMRANLHSPAFREGVTGDGVQETSAKMKVAADNAFYALHCLVELIQQNNASWLHDVLAQIGVQRLDRDAVFLLAQTGDTAAASRCLERMLFEGDR